MSAAEKALAAIREYDRLMTAIAQNKLDIGNGLGKCENLVSATLHGEDVSYMREGGVSHLEKAFAPHIDNSSMFDELAYNTPEEIAEILSECPGCQEAYAAIQERKANRKKLGAVKRAMRMIGRAKA